MNCEILKFSFDKSQLKEIMAVQKRVHESFNVEGALIRKAHEYSQSLFEQFGLDSNDELLVNQYLQLENPDRQ